MSDDSSCDSGDPEYYFWRHEISLPKDNPVEDEMVECCLDEGNASADLRDYVQSIREENKNLLYEVKILRMWELDAEAHVSSLKHELTLNQVRDNNEIMSGKINAFVLGFISGIVLFSLVV